MEPFSLMVIIFLLLVVGPTSFKLYDKKVLAPRRTESKRIMLEDIKSERLAIQTRHDQHAALTIEDKIWLFDRGWIHWAPEEEIGFEPEYNGTNTCIYYHEDLVRQKRAYLWDLPDWYVDFLSTRPFHSDLAKRFYDWACEGKEVKTHIAELKQARLDQIAEVRRADEEKKRKHQEWLVEKDRLEREEMARLKQEREESDRRKAVERNKRALELEEERRVKLGLTGTYIDTVINLYRTGSWGSVRNEKYDNAVTYAPGSNASLAVKELQRTFGLPVTGSVDRATLREIEVQADIQNLLGMKLGYATNTKTKGIS